VRLLDSSISKKRSLLLTSQVLPDGPKNEQVLKDKQVW
jgi:hypothetical protein